ncbi:MAG TPA: sigma-70 family RNA polymerase sigma factor [Flavobacteriaceae bacterium]|nr:sigma-70 family RNA polymerase sigma factor [Flavobacteriaceae bacterium]
MARNLQEHVCEESVFAALYKKHAKNLRDFLYYKFGERLNPEDHVQEAFVKLWKKCKEVPPEKAKSFLFTVANNQVLNAIKHEKVVLKFQSQKKENTNHHDPHFLLEETEYLKKYQTALANLSEAQRVAFLMNRAEGKKHQEIAELLGISKKAVEKRIYGALKSLRKDIKGI